MALDATIRIKISSEAAGAVALTPVVVQEMPMIELLQHIAGATSADAGRVRDLLKRGTLVSGASRFRWEPLECSLEDVAAALERLPQPDPHRPFDQARCRAIILAAAPRRWEISRSAASERRLLHRRSFWSELLAACPAPEYVTYRHKDRADLYRSALSGTQCAQINSAAPLLRYEKLAADLRAARITAIDWIVER